MRITRLTNWAFIIGFLTMIIFSSCTAVKVSRYAKYNQFEYTGYQPSFHFSNDSLGIYGNWFHGTGSRVVPRPSYFPKPTRKILRRFSREHGPMLFSTWSPNRKKYSVKGFVPVKKKDVRFRGGAYNIPYYRSVHVSEHPFSIDISGLNDCGRNRDYQFKIYATELAQLTDSLWAVRAFAVGERGYYAFICIQNNLGKEMTDDKRKWNSDLFVADVKRMVTEKEEEDDAANRNTNYSGGAAKLYPRLPADPPAKLFHTGPYR